MLVTGGTGTPGREMVHQLPALYYHLLNISILAGQRLSAY